jgi:hypothetical protein
LWLYRRRIRFPSPDACSMIRYRATGNLRAPAMLSAGSGRAGRARYQPAWHSSQQKQQEFSTTIHCARLVEEILPAPDCLVRRNGWQSLGAPDLVCFVTHTFIHYTEHVTLKMTRRERRVGRMSTKLSRLSKRLRYTACSAPLRRSTYPRTILRCLCLVSQCTP